MVGTANFFSQINYMFMHRLLISKVVEIRSSLRESQKKIVELRKAFDCSRLKKLGVNASGKSQLLLESLSRI